MMSFVEDISLERLKRQHVADLFPYAEAVVSEHLYNSVCLLDASEAEAVR